MKLPWKNRDLKEKIEELETTVERKTEEVNKLEEMLEAEEKRRSKLAREKQEAEEKLNRLQDKVKGLKSEEKAEEASSEVEFEDISFENFQDSLRKLRSLRSDKEDLVTVYSPQKLSEHEEISSIKNSMPKENLRPLLNKENILIFYSNNLGVFCFRSRPFYEEKFTLNDRFDVEEALDFINSKKNWALISRGESTIYYESKGEFEEFDRIKDRVNSQHGKGGFSQGRFERKRDEQVEQHLENVKEKLEELENIYLLGDKSMCKDLPGKHLGGFDPNSTPIKNFYRPRRLKVSTLPR